MEMQKQELMIKIRVGNESGTYRIFHNSTPTPIPSSDPKPASCNHFKIIKSYIFLKMISLILL